MRQCSRGEEHLRVSGKRYHAKQVFKLAAILNDYKHRLLQMTAAGRLIFDELEDVLRLEDSEAMERANSPSGGVKFDRGGDLNAPVAQLSKLVSQSSPSTQRSADALPSIMPQSTSG